jgi:hypothetical protein
VGTRSNLVLRSGRPAGSLCGSPGLLVISLKDALEDTRDSEMKLKAFPEVCNETMMALWEECKPCLKHTCMKFYARVCRSGSGLVGQQVRRRDVHSLGSGWGMWRIHEIGLIPYAGYS